MIKHGLLALLLFLAPPADAQIEVQFSDEEIARMETAQEAMRAYHARLSEQLALSGGARELAFAAMLRRLASRNPHDAETWGNGPSRNASSSGSNQSAPKTGVSDTAVLLSLMA